MDERESIPRREALAGLGLLSLLSAGLVGTIVFRIVNAAPRQGAHDPTEVASTYNAAEDVNSADPSAPAGVASHAVVAAHEETADADEVPLLSQAPPTTSLGSSVSADAASEAPRWNPPETASPAQRPSFVAPANR
jgi:hypothetical protein